MDNKRAHLNMIQGVINRLADNSFRLKYWSVILVSALFALAATNTKMVYIYLAYIPAISFWILDGYYLWQERLFGDLYEDVRKKDENQIDFSMTASEVAGEENTWLNAFFSKTIILFHGFIVLAVVVVMILGILLDMDKSV